jgi:MoaA/NifB/PqqE/SkfB family radical SAM enzyme
MTTTRKRCSWIHNTLNINPKGEVSACCHQQPGVVGNIYQNTLQEIFDGERLKEYRQQEIDGTLHCVKACTLVQKPNVPDHLDGDYHTKLTRLLIEFGEFCNIACVMCTQDHASRLELDPETIVKNIEIPKSCQNVTFFGGEPTILKSAKRFFDHCAAHGTKVSFITNGTAITEEMAAKIALHCRSISFSLNAATKEMHELVNAGSQFDRVVRNVRRVIEAKQRLSGEVAISGHMTIVVQNIHEIPLFIKKRVEFGFESLNFGYDHRVPALLAKDPEMKQRLASDVQAAIAEDRNIPPIRPSYWPARIDVARLRMLDLV